MTHPSIHSTCDGEWGLALGLAHIEQQAVWRAVCLARSGPGRTEPGRTWIWICAWWWPT
ncbi:hypothetical protein BC567DRAFT_216675 [Phyllosticta citribraziliensis]